MASKKAQSVTVPLAVALAAAACGARSGLLEAIGVSPLDSDAGGEGGAAPILEDARAAGDAGPMDSRAADDAVAGKQGTGPVEEGGAIGDARAVEGDALPDASDSGAVPDSAGAVVPICQPQCADAPCGGDDGCGGICPGVSCGMGQRCRAGACVCDATSCTGCCEGAACLPGDAWTACGSGGATCTACVAESVCTAGQCGPTYRVVLYGGTSSHYVSGVFDDTWEWDGRQWTLIITTGPGVLPISPMAAFADKIVLLRTIDPTTPAGIPHQVTWEFDGALWRERNVPGPPSDPPLAATAFAGKAVVCCVGEATQPLSWDAWAWDGMAWAIQSTLPPPPMGIIAGSGSIIEYPAIVSFQSKLLYLGDLLEGPATFSAAWDGQTWTRTHSSGIPDTLFVAAIAARTTELVALAQPLQGGSMMMTYTSPDGLTWTLRTTPAALGANRWGAAIATLNDRVVLFGGAAEDPNGNPKTPLSDTWEWDGNAWTQLNVAGPPARYSHSMATLCRGAPCP